VTLIALGLNHKTAPIDIRERLSFGPDIVVGALRSLAEQAGAGEAVIVSTCNRTEIYCAGTTSTATPSGSGCRVFTASTARCSIRTSTRTATRRR